MFVFYNGMVLIVKDSVISVETPLPGTSKIGSVADPAAANDRPCPWFVTRNEFQYTGCGGVQ
jgi:hypothetical protein